MVERVDPFATDYTVGINQHDPILVELCLQVFVYARTASRKTIDRLDDKELDIVLWIFTVVNRGLHRLDVLGAGFHKREVLLNLHIPHTGKALYFIMLVFRRVAISALLFGRYAYCA